MHSVPVGRLVLPALMLATGVGAFAGLAAQPALPGRVAGPAVSVAAAVAVLDRERSLVRASRTRPAPIPTPAAPVPVAQAPVAAPVPAPVQAQAAVPPVETAVERTCPVPSATFTDTWGAPRSGGRRHEGTDLMARSGAPVYAVTAGVVDTTSSTNGGLSLYLRASNGDRFFYAHNSQNVARDGARVQAGDLIARVGNTGNARGGPAHVHFEMEPGGGGAVNPYRFLRRLCG